MKKAHSLTVLALILLSSNVFANVEQKSFFSFLNRPKKEKSCSNIDLRSPALGEVRNQGSSGWCFAYTAADLVTHKTNQKISASDLAISFYTQMPEMPRTDLLSRVAGGSDLGAITSIKNRYCTEDLMPSTVHEIPSECLTKKQNVDTLSILAFIENLHAKKPANLSQCEIAIVNSLFKNMAPNQIEEVILNKKQTSLEKIETLRVENCADKRIKPEVKVAMRPGLKGKSEVVSEIDEQLEKGNIVSYNYDAHFLLNTPRDPNGVANHYSSIVARRMGDDNKCEYLIRNSWGPDCSIYPAKYQKQCEEGNIWVEEEVIKENTLGISYLR